MLKRSWFSDGADQRLDRLVPRCDDPPTIAQALAAAPDTARLAEEDQRGRTRT